MEKTEWHSRRFYISIDQTSEEKEQYLSIRWKGEWRQLAHRFETLGKRQVPRQAESGSHGIH